MKNNSIDKKIIKMIKEDYKSIKPSSELKKKIERSYQNYYTSQNNTKNNIIINLLQMIQINKTALSLGAITMLIIGGVTFYLLQNSNEKLAVNHTKSISTDKKVDNRTDKIIDDLNKNSDNTTTLAQSKNNSTSNNSDTILDNINLDDLDDTLNGLNEVDSILDEDVFGDDLF